MRTNEEAKNFVDGKLELLEIVGGKIKKEVKSIKTDEDSYE